MTALSSWWLRPEDLVRASLRVLVACRQGLDQGLDKGLGGLGQDADEERDDARRLLPRLRECLRARLLTSVDALVDADTVPLAYGVSLERRARSAKPRG